MSSVAKEKAERSKDLATIAARMGLEPPNPESKHLEEKAHTVEGKETQMPKQKEKEP